MESLEGGLGGEQAKEMLRNVAETIESWLRLAMITRDMGRSAGALDSSLVEQLDAAEGEIQRAKSAVEKVRELLSGTRKPLDRVRLEHGTKEFDEGRFRSAQDLRASLDS
jgi:predicted translin family RNA/ssDNA-binding protein